LTTGNVGETRSVRSLFDDVQKEVHKVIIGNDEAIEIIFVSLLCQGHVLLEGTPGLAKTYLARTFASALDLDFRRIQFTADMLPSDILGSLVYNRTKEDFEFKRGPLFANIILADELNRAPPRSQSALLEAMQERQVTVEGKRYELPSPFMVIATQNPVEQEGTYPLPEGELDRFGFRVYMKFLGESEEVQILGRKQLIGETVEVNKVTDANEIRSAISKVKQVFVDKSLMEYITRIVSTTRRDSRILLGASPRAMIATLYASKAVAAIDGRDYVIPDDIKHVAKWTMNHRLILKADYLAETVGKGDTWVNDVLEKLVDETIRTIEAPR
jgi:MoxR-like ATPase